MNNIHCQVTSISIRINRLSFRIFVYNIIKAKNYLTKKKDLIFSKRYNLGNKVRVLCTDGLNTSGQPDGLTSQTYLIAKRVLSKFLWVRKTQKVQSFPPPHKFSLCHHFVSPASEHLNTQDHNGPIMFRAYFTHDDNIPGLRCWSYEIHFSLNLDLSLSLTYSYHSGIRDTQILFLKGERKNLWKSEICSIPKHCS